jgi:hypothetical protein
VFVVDLFHGHPFFAIETQTAGSRSTARRMSHKKQCHASPEFHVPDRFAPTTQFFGACPGFFGACPVFFRARPAFYTVPYVFFPRWPFFFWGRPRFFRGVPRFFWGVPRMCPDQIGAAPNAGPCFSLRLSGHWGAHRCARYRCWFVQSLGRHHEASLPQQSTPGSFGELVLLPS